MLNHFTLPKIPKYDGRRDLVKHLNSFKTHMGLRGAIPTMKYIAFCLSLSGTTEVWYTRLEVESIRSWSDFEKVFLKCFATSKEEDEPIQRLQDMRQQSGKLLKSFLTCFTYEITYCVQVIDREALTALKRGLNMNSLFWRDMQNKDHTSYNVLLEMI